MALIPFLSRTQPAIDVVQWPFPHAIREKYAQQYQIGSSNLNAGDAPGHVYACKFPEPNLSTLTQLIVHESQEAILFSKGRLLGKFGPGKHTLTTENLPILR